MRESFPKLKNELEKFGQLTPVTLEETSHKEFRILDGFQRIYALRQIQKKTGQVPEVLCDIHKKADLIQADRFRIVMSKNFHGPQAYGVFEKSLAIKHFYDLGLSIEWLSRNSSYNIHQIEDMIDLGEAGSAFGILINPYPLDPTLSLILLNRFRGWIQTPYRKKALHITKNWLGWPQLKN